MVNFEIKNRKDFRKRLEENPEASECFLVLKRGEPKDPNVFYYLDAVEEALCFGWIDSTTRIIDGITVQRFSPRNKKAVWSELNKERVRRLERLGLMTERGRKVLPDMDVNSFKFEEDFVEILKNNGLWKTFCSFPPLYQRIRAYNIAFNKKINYETYQKSLDHLIEVTKEGKMYGERNDYGRLLEK